MEIGAVSHPVALLRLDAYGDRHSGSHGRRRAAGFACRPSLPLGGASARGAGGASRLQPPARLVIVGVSSGVSSEQIEWPPDRRGSAASPSPSHLDTLPVADLLDMQRNDPERAAALLLVAEEEGQAYFAESGLGMNFSLQAHPQPINLPPNDRIIRRRVAEPLENFYKWVLLSPPEATIMHGTWPEEWAAAAERAAGITDACDVALIVPFCHLDRLPALFPAVKWRHFEATSEFTSDRIVSTPNISSRICM